jgi:hypothetical protein
MMPEPADAEILEKIKRIDRFRDALRDAIAETPVDPRANCAEAQRRTLRRIAETLHAVSGATLYNLAVIDIATNGAIMAAARLYLLAAGSGRTLDYADGRRSLPSSSR